MSIILDTTNSQVTVEGTSSTAGKVILHESTANGTHYVGLSAPDSVAASVNFKLPASDGTVGQVIQTDGSGNLSFTAGGVSIGKAIATSLIFGL